MAITKILFCAPGLLHFSNGDAGKYWETLKNLAPAFSDIEGFVVASTHWRPKGKFLVNQSRAPVFLGTEENASLLPMKGEPELAKSLAQLGEATGLWAETTEEWGFDPGHWHFLPFFSEKGKKFAVPISLSQMSPEAHRKWGVAVQRGIHKWPAPLALLISGSLSHRSDLTEANPAEISPVQKFDEEILEMFTKRTSGKLDDMEKALFKAAQPEGGWGSLYFLRGAVGENAPASLEYYERPLPGVGSAVLLFYFGENSSVPKA